MVSRSRLDIAVTWVEHCVDHQDPVYLSQIPHMTIDEQKSASINVNR